MKRVLSVAVFLLFLGICVIPSYAGSTIKQPMSSVAFDGDTLYVGGGGPGNYTSIQDAIDNASNGDTIFIFSGLYEENIMLDKSINLIGENRNTTIIDGNRNDNVICIYADDVKVETCTIQNAKDDFHHAGIEISNANNVVLTNNNIQNNYGFGIYIHDSIDTKLLLFENLITNNSYGIYVVESSNLNISNNAMLDNNDGIYVVHSSNIEFFDNTVTNYGLGIHISSSFDITISKNLITDNSNGIYNYDSTNILISGNTVKDNRWYGVWFRDSSDNTITKNIVTNNVDIGLFFDNSTSNIINKNTIIDNDDGLYLERSSKNLIQNNNFRNYKFNAYFVASSVSQCLNRWKNNFWDRAHLLPHPILGKIKLEKCSFSWLNFDWTPLKKPYESHISEIFASDKSILYVGGSGPGNYSHIQDAIDDASDNDTVYVFNGTYDEEIIIYKPLHLIGEDKQSTILEGNGISDIITILSSYVEVRQFTIQNGHFSIFINNSSNILITENIIVNSLQGISIQNDCSHITISKNTFDYNQYGIRLYSSSYATVNYNNFQSYKLNAFFVGTSFVHCKQSWSHNYWGTPRTMPYIIFGKIRIGNLLLPWINIDWQPLNTPYKEAFNK
jgi:parallel beta-helix repeat protein